MDLSVLKIPEKKQKQLLDSGIETIEQLARLYPRKYEDFREITPMSELRFYEGENAAVVGTIAKVEGKRGVVAALVDDDNGTRIHVRWFNQAYLVDALREGQKYVFYGKVSWDSWLGCFGITSPAFFSDNPADFGKILPVYKKVRGMSQEYLSRCIEQAAGLLIANPELLEDPVPEVIRRKVGVPDMFSFLTKVHKPENEIDLQSAQARIELEILYPFAAKMAERRITGRSNTEYVVHHSERMRRFCETLPYPLTSDQAGAIQAILEVVQSGKRADALLQGDVGCGKTTVAMALSVLFAENGYQTAVMAPTSILAMQHFREFQKWLTPLGIRVELLSSGMKKRERDALLSRIVSGESQVVVGTHAVIAEGVDFHELALTIVDEEHRFGVRHRDALREKAKAGVHSVNMTATPIPRTLSLALYGENTMVLNIKTMPGGRKKVVTVSHSDQQKVFAAMARQVKAGHQCYIVCPLVDESDSEAMAEVSSVDKTHREVSDWFSANMPGVVVDKITGGLKQETIEKRLEEFSSGQTSVLVSTTIVEVGVNVPNATVMVISNAERFGLAQMHQLRGRVGRGDAQSYCVLLTKKMTPRIQAMLDTADGFEIAQKDLALRGCGSLTGTRQHGYDTAVEAMLRHPDWYKLICDHEEQRYRQDKRRFLT